MTKPLLDGADLKLGLFSANCSSGMAVTKIADRWQATWDDNVRLARLADDVGIDFMLPIARWIGYGGETNFHESVLDPVVLAAGLLAETKRLFVFATVHTAFDHPLVTAKAMATVDQIGRGRAGLNIVAGWNKPEYDAMDSTCPQDHDDRYGARTGVVRALTVKRCVDRTRAAGTVDGRFWSLKGVEALPKPYDGAAPPSLNAGSVDPGPRLRRPELECRLHGRGRGQTTARLVVAEGDCRTRGTPTGARSASSRRRTCVCRPTKAEAEEYHRWYAEENADWDAVDNLMTLQGLHAQSFSAEMLQMFRGRFAGGHGVCPLIGSPDDVAAEIKRFWDAGFKGMTLSFVDYVGEPTISRRRFCRVSSSWGRRTPR